MDDERRLIDADELEVAISAMPDFGWVTIDGEGRAVLFRLDVLKIIAAQPTVSLAPPPTNACAEPAWPRPIPVTERLPDDGVRVLVFGSNESLGRTTSMGVRHHGAPWTVIGVHLDSVTHWLPLPPPPAE